MPATKRRDASLPTLADIAKLIGGEDAALHTAILNTGATFAEIEQAVLAAQGADEALGETSHPLEGRAAMVFELLAADRDEEP